MQALGALAQGRHNASVGLCRCQRLGGWAAAEVAVAEAVAVVVDDQKRRPEQLAELLVEAAPPFGRLRGGPPIRWRWRRRRGGRRGRRECRARSRGRPRRCRAGRADDVILGREEAEPAEVQPQRRPAPWAGSRSELFRGHACGKASLLDPRLAAVRVTGGDVSRKQRLSEALVAHSSALARSASLGSALAGSSSARSPGCTSTAASGSVTSAATISTKPSSPSAAARSASSSSRPRSHSDRRSQAAKTQPEGGPERGLPRIRAR